MGFDPSALLNNTAQGAAASVVSGAIGQGFSALSAARDWKFAKKLMSRQHAYELENLAAQDKYQRQLALDASSLRKRSLQNAGYSTADPEGTGTVAPTVSAPSSSASGMSISQSPTFAPGMTVTDLANANLMNSQAELNRIEAKYRADKLKKEIDKYQIEIKTMQDKLPEEISVLRSTVQELQSRSILNDKQVSQLDSSISKIAEETNGIQIDNKWRDSMNEWQLDKLKNEVYNLSNDGDIKAVQAKLAEYGILIGADWMTQVAAMAIQSHGTELVDKLSKFLGSVLGSIPQAGSTVVSSGITGAIISGAKQLPIVGGIIKYAQEFIGKCKEEERKYRAGER